MRKRKREELTELISDTVNREIMKMTKETVLQELYVVLKALNVDVAYLGSKISKDIASIEETMSSYSFELYLCQDKTIVEVAHYHKEDCMWVLTHLNEVKTLLQGRVVDFIEYIKDNVTIDERN